MKRTKNKKPEPIQKDSKQLKGNNSEQKNLFIPLILSLLVFFLNFLFIPEHSKTIIPVLGQIYYYCLAILNSLLIFWALLKPSNFRPFIKYIFLIIILLIILHGIYISLEGENIYESGIIQKIKKSLIIFASSIGMISIYFEKSKLLEIIESLFRTKQLNRNKLSLSERFKLPFSKKERFTNFVFILILGISVFTLFYKLDHFDLYSDEISVTRGAAGYYNTGEYKQWDFIKEETVGQQYNRAKPHQFIVSQSFKIFGINAMGARFPSAIFGILLITFLFAFGKYFIKDKIAILLTIFSIALNYEFLSLGRWARMYAMIYPGFILAFYWTFKFLNEDSLSKFVHSGKNTFLNKYFNFRFIYLPALLVLIYINLYTHQNTSLIFSVFLMVSFFSIFLFYKEKKYITAFIVAIGILILQIINPLKVGFSRFTLFKMDHSDQYSDSLFSYPFSFSSNIVILLIGLFIFFTIKHHAFRKKYLPLFLTAGITWVLFSFIFNYPAHFRYVSFVTPIIFLLIIGIYYLIIKTLYKKTIQIIFTTLLIFSGIVHYSNNYNNLYISNKLSPAVPSKAYQSITDNFTKGDVIFRHWGPKLYMKGINPDTEFISLGSYEGKAFIDIYEELKKHNSGWLTWHTHHNGRMDKPFIIYTNLYFKKYHGYAVDKTGVEVFYYNQNMMVSLDQFFAQQLLPTANLSSNQSYSISFSLNFNSKTEGKLFSLLNDSHVNIECSIQNDSLRIKNPGSESLKSGLDKNRLNHFVWFQKNENGKRTHGLFFNGQLIAETRYNSNADLFKFQINPTFTENIDKIRLYDFVLNKNQVDKIISENLLKESSETLEDNNGEFKPLYIWQKR